MTALARSLARILAPLNSIALWLSALGLVAMTAAVAWQVYGRYVLNDSPTWVEPISIQLMGWFILLGAAVGVREGYHLGFEVLRAIVPRTVARLMSYVSDALVGGFGLAMAWYGAELARGTWTARLPVLGWPGGVDFLPLVAGGILIALFSLERIVNTLAGADAALARG
jgi:TRAP-type C4-dicarboxylate transport system permease small subunit